MIKVNLLNLLDQDDRNLNWLSVKARINYSTLYNFAHQKTAAVTYDVLEKICYVLNCDIKDIICYIRD